jgi:predicted RNA-binding Zn ribbon-like protein
MTEHAMSNVNDLELLGGNLCLDFANTVDHDRTGATRHEYLTDARSVIDWARHVGIIDERTRSTLQDLLAEKPDEGQAVFERALELRTVIQHIFTAIARGTEPPPNDLAWLQRSFRDALDQSRLTRHGGAFDWAFEPGRAGIDIVLALVTLAAIDLLRSGPLHRVKRCPGDNDQCGWLFLDTSKNGSRRWCSMRTCGSRDKMRRMYQRHRS